MTTRVFIENKGDSNPLQKLSLVIRNASGPHRVVLRPGQSHEAWISSGSEIDITEVAAETEIDGAVEGTVLLTDPENKDA
jgi:hypothetical protein